MDQKDSTALKETLVLSEVTLVLSEVTSDSSERRIRQLPDASTG